jgi:putative phage-type endonuclease
MRVIDCAQGSDEWLAARCGKVTASRIADLTAKTKTGYGASRANYMAELVAERLTGSTAESYTNAAMQWGKDHEHEARTLYEFYAEATVSEVGFVLHPTLDDAGASPDGLVGTGGLVEIKCPNTATHIDTLLSGTIPDKYIKQMQWQMLCCCTTWCDFVSFDPRLPARMQLFVKRLTRSDELLAELEHEVRIFLRELDGKMSALTQKYGTAA